LGRSDPIVFEWYSDKIRVVKGSDVLFLGQPRHSLFTQTLDCRADFRDITLGNWDIKHDLVTDRLYDAVICTRCAYFSPRPKSLVSQCLSVLRPGGKLFIDWGLGDHWRFPTFSVGWNRGDEKEFAVYACERQYLRSAVWRESLEQDDQVLDFKRNIQKFGYSGMLGQTIRQEVDSVYEIPDSAIVSCLSLWPDSPQLYILLEISNAN